MADFFIVLQNIITKLISPEAVAAGTFQPVYYDHCHYLLLMLNIVIMLIVIIVIVAAGTVTGIIHYYY